MKYEDMKDQYITDEYGFKFVGKYHMLGKEPKPCGMCGSMTRSIDVFSEGYICSEECQDKFDSWCNEVLNSCAEE
jgi:hypothetical protein